MQSQEEVESTCYANELAAAERHMEDVERGDEHEGGVCGGCAYCYMRCFDEAKLSWMRDELNARYGICNGHDTPYLVSLDEEHEWGDCFVPMKEEWR